MQKKCIQCYKTFQIKSEDLEFYKKVGVPVPQICFDCRKQKRFMWRNERFLYERKCDLTGKKIISVYAPNKPYKVYEQSKWWSDEWDALVYGRDFDFSRSFFDQFKDLYLTIPKMSMMVNSCSENSDYSLYLDIGKNCYLCISGAELEDCHYCFFTQYSKNCLDCAVSRRCELCYECLDCDGCYNVNYAQDSTNCMDSWYLSNCHDCHDCFGCINLQHKKNYIFNQEYSPEKYQKMITDYLSSSQSRKAAQEKFEDIKKRSFVRYYHGQKNTNVFGDYISSSINSYMCFDAEELENCSYITNGMKGKDTYDCEYFMNSEMCYECLSNPNTYNCRFNDFVWDSQFVDYSSYCFYSHDLFGCAGVKHNNHCILNKKYSPNAYLKLKEQIINYMKKTGEWGHFFPSSISPFAYNESIAQISYPLTKEEALARKWQWRPKNDRDYQKANGEMLSCDKCGKNYKFIPAEKSFYKNKKIIPPLLCPDCRYFNRMKLRNPRSLWHRQCQKPDCHHTFETTYSPDRKELVYCEECYNKEIY